MDRGDRRERMFLGSGSGYLKTACDYVHLNPARAHLLGTEDRLLACPWSSFGCYLAAPEHRPGGMRVNHLLGEHGIAAELAIAVRLRNQTTLPVNWIGPRTTPTQTRADRPTMRTTGIPIRCLMADPISCETTSHGVLITHARHAAIIGSLGLVWEAPTQEGGKSG